MSDAASSRQTTACEERTHLLDEYAKAMKEYFAASERELQHYRDTTSTADHEELRRGVEQARHFSHQKRRALRRHVAEHLCESS
jgi:hypothetical protein